MRPLLPWAAALAVLAATAPQTALAHGDVDESVADFHEHLDDYRSEVQAFLGELPPIVAAYRDGDDVKAMADGLIDRWEAVAVHGAIETHATVTYPGIWQALTSLQQAARQGRPAEDVAAAAEGVKAAMWQGFGALRLAAAQVESGDAALAGGSAPAEAGSGPESIDRIVAQLEEALEAYAGGDAARAGSMVEAAYMQRFEYLEGDLIEQDAELVTRLEQDFNATLPLLMQEGAAVDEVRAALAQMKDALSRARTLLAEAEQSRSKVF